MGQAGAGVSRRGTRRGAETRERLLAAASRLIAEQGFDATSVESIASAAGITVPGMYKHFTNKATVLLEVARRANRTSAARQALGAGGDLAAELADLFGEFTAAGEVERRRLSIELSRAASQNDELRERLAGYNQRLRDSLCATILDARPALTAHRGEVEQLAHLLLVLLMGVIHIDTLDPDLTGDPRLVAFLRGRFADLLDEPLPPKRRRAGRATPVTSVDVAEELEPEPADGRRRRTTRTRKRILDAAAELFALHGYDATSTEMLAAKAEITVPGLYLHVASKEELLVEVGRRTFTRYRLVEPLDHDGDVVSHLAEHAVAFSSANHHVRRRLAIELDFGAWRSAELAAALRTYHRSVRRNVAEALGSPGAAVAEPELGAMAVVMLFMGIAHIDTIDPSLVGDARWYDTLRHRLPQLVGDAEPVTPAGA